MILQSGKLIVIVFCFVVYFQSIIFSVYQIPAENQKEILENYQLVQASPENQYYQFELAMSYAYSGRVQEGWDVLKNMDDSFSKDALKVYSDKLENNKNDWKLYFKLAFVYYFNDDIDRSHEYFLKVLDIDSENVWAMSFIALLETQEKEPNPELIIFWCQKALAIQPELTATYLLLAEAQRQNGDYFDSVKSFIKFGRLKSEEKKLKDGKIYL